MIAVVVAAASVVVVTWILDRSVMSVGARVAIASIPVLAFAVCLVTYLRLIRTLDEMQRRVHLEALGFAFPATAVVVLAFEYLRKAGVLLKLKPDYVLLAMAVLWLVGYILARRRYQ